MHAWQLVTIILYIDIFIFIFFCSTFNLLLLYYIFPHFRLSASTFYQMRFMLK